MAEEQELGSGPGGMVLPEDLKDPPKEEAGVPGNEESSMAEAAALGNGEDFGVDGTAGRPGTGRRGSDLPADLGQSMVEEASALGNGAEPQAAEAARKGNGEDRDWSEVDRHSERVLGALYSLVKGEGGKAQETLRQMLDRNELNFRKVLEVSEGKFEKQLQEIMNFVKFSVGAPGREQAAAAWRGPAEALRLLGGVLAALSEKAGQDTIGEEELRNMSPVLKTAEDHLLRACQHEEGRLPVIDEALGGTGTHGARTELVARSVGEAVVLVEKMVRGTEAPSRRTIAVLLAGCVVGLAGVFGAEGKNSEFVQRVERLRQERAGPVEGAESNEVRAFRADFGREMERLRSAMRWRERGIWAAGLAFCLLFGWAAGISGLDLSFVDGLL